MSAARILVVAHGHPDFSLGGGELAAYHLFKAYRSLPEVDQAWFLARMDNRQWPTGRLSLRREGEYLWDQGMHDWHHLRAAHPESVREGLMDLVAGLRPTIVHAHHYAHLGLDYLVMLRRRFPGLRIFLTLHEYMAICQHNGQMVTTQDLRLCKEATPEDCHRCFPERTPEDFWLRKSFIQDRLAVVDGFVAPSEFLRQRYIAWGIPSSRIVTLENGLPAQAPVAPRALEAGEHRNRFGFFGQINPYKGLDLLLEGLLTLSRSERRQVVLDVNGAHLEQQPQAMRDRISGLLSQLAPYGTVQWRGPYRPEDMRSRLAQVDWVVVPSIWWENSPLVIQEAFSAGRPVLCSDIGGMAEKVRDGIDGWHVPARSAQAWGQALLRVSQDNSWDRLAAAIRRPTEMAEAAHAHLQAFRSFPTELRQAQRRVAGSDVQRP